MKNLSLTIIITLAASFAIYSQPQSPERGTNSNKSYSVSDIETISMQSGNVMFNVPLGSLPPGRGGMSAGLSLNYNSKLWDNFSDEVAGKWKDRILKAEDGGWRYRYRFHLSLDFKRGAECQTEGDPIDNHNTRLNVVFPDGSSHGLSLLGYSNESGHVEFNPDGKSGCSPETFSGDITYHTTDGTFARLTYHADNDSDWTNNGWTLYMPDGSRVVTAAAVASPVATTSYIVQTMYDRNGNAIEIVETTQDSLYSNRKTTYVRDAIGRKVVIEYAAATNEDHIHSKGVGNTAVKTRVLWKSVGVHKDYNGCNVYPSETGGGAGACNNLAINTSLTVVDKVYLPQQFGDTGSSTDYYYEFGYNGGSSTPTTGYGEINYVKTPSGAEAEYDYVLDGIEDKYSSEILTNRIDAKRLTYDVQYDGSTSSTTDTWTYAYTYHDLGSTGSAPNRSTATAEITGPDGSKQKEYYSEEGDLYRSDAPNGSRVEKFYEYNRPTANDGASANRFAKYEFNTIADSSGDPSLTAIKEYTRDKNGNVTEVKEYDFVAFSTIPRTSGLPTGLPSGISSSLKRISQTEYYNPTPDSASTTYNDADSYHLASSNRLLGLAKVSKVLDSSSTPKSRSEITYDYTDYSSSNTVAGNLTQSKVWDSFKCGSAQSYSDPLTGTNSITSSATYDSYGNILTTTDANSIETHVTYGSIGGYSGLYPTQTVVAHGTSLARTSTATYDFYSGAVLSTTDEDNDITNSMEYDDLGRPINEISADGTALESWTQTVYDDVNRRIVVKADLEAVGDEKKVATQFFDQLGRVRLAKTLEDASTQSATDETDGIKVQTRYKTASGYSYQLSSNPYRADYSYNETDATIGWTLSTAWSSGIRSEVQTFSGAGLPTAFGGSNTASTGIVRTDIDANATTVADQASKLRRSITNGLGQLVRVDEPNSSNALGTVASPNQATSYAYDVLNNLLTVTQASNTTAQCGGASSCSQTRTFAYSSLSRLTSATNPESGTISYVYDSNGNLTSKTDARSIVTSYVYDALSRVTDRNYTNEPSGSETPDVDYFYGTTAPKVGKLTKVTSSVSTTEYTSFDILGRVTGHKQSTDGVDYTTGYTYKLSGALDEQTYPSGRVVKNELDVAGDLASVTSKENSSAIFKTYVNDFAYNAAGAVTSLRLGNGRFESTTFNSRLQPTQIALGHSEADSSLLKLAYGYGTTANDGNVLTQDITVKRSGTSDLVFNQTFTYDELNRLKVAEEKTGTTTNWKQTFTFDRYGNRRFDEGNTTMPSSFSNQALTNPTISTSNNRLTSTGWTYDSAGNTVGDPGGRQFTYDAENKQTEVENSSNASIGTYFFDGDGKRVKKVVPSTGETTIFVYDAAGKLTGEYSTIVQNSTNAKVQYLTQDSLGTPRINTDAIGAVTSRSDYLPYGEELTTQGSRSSAENYQGDTVRQRFTGYENDAETELEFAQARMYHGLLGRFQSSDVLLASGQTTSPQSWNRYTYSLNSPVNLTDPTGLYTWDASLGGGKKDDELNKTEDGRKIVGRRNEIRTALTSAADIAMNAVLSGELTSEQAGKIFDSLSAYGDEGQDNGLLLKLGEVDGGDAETDWQEIGQGTGLKTDDKTYRTKALVQITFEAGNITPRNVVHEGSHANDRQNLALAMDDPAMANVSPYNRTQNISMYETERRAYMATSYVDQAMKSTSHNLWQRGWTEADRTSAVNRHIRNVDKLSPPGTKPGPGKNIYSPVVPKR